MKKLKAYSTLVFLGILFLFPSEAFARKKKKVPPIPDPAFIDSIKRLPEYNMKYFDLGKAYQQWNLDSSTYYLERAKLVGGTIVQRATLLQLKNALNGFEPSEGYKELKQYIVNARGKVSNEVFRDALILKADYERRSWDFESFKQTLKSCFRFCDSTSIEHGRSKGLFAFLIAESGDWKKGGHMEMERAKKLEKEGRYEAAIEAALEAGYIYSKKGEFDVIANGNALKAATFVWALSKKRNLPEYEERGWSLWHFSTTRYGTNVKVEGPKLRSPNYYHRLRMNFERMGGLLVDSAYQEVIDLVKRKTIFKLGKNKYRKDDYAFYSRLISKAYKATGHSWEKNARFSGYEQKKMLLKPTKLQHMVLELNIELERFPKELAIRKKEQLIAQQQAKNLLAEKNLLLSKTELELRNQALKLSQVESQRKSDSLAQKEQELQLKTQASLLDKQRLENKENELLLKNQEIAFNKRMYTGIGLLALVLAGGGYYVYHKNQQRKKLKLNYELLEIRHKALQLQLNPHFIFNALATLKSVIQQNKLDQAKIGLYHLSSLMRGILYSSREEEVPLDDEIKTLTSFFELNKILGLHEFEYEINSNGIDIEEYGLPPMMIQPLIENSLKHGIGPMKEKGKIKVNFDLKEDHMEISVSDNGVGRHATKLKAEKGLSVSTKIIKERLEKLMPQLSNAFEIIDLSEPSGTKVVMRLPIVSLWD